MLRNDNIIKKISPIARILILFIIVLSLIVAKSLYLILFVTVLVLIVCVLNTMTLKEYFNFIRIFSFIPLILIATYVLIFKEYNLIKIFLIIYKLIICIICIKLFDKNTTFGELHQAIYGIFFIIRRSTREKITFDIALSLILVRIFFYSKIVIAEKNKNLGLKRFRPIYNLKCRIIYTLKEFENLQMKLKLDFYKLNHKKMNFASKVILSIFFAFLIVCIFKEVIL